MPIAPPLQASTGLTLFASTWYAATKYATGLTNVTDLAFGKGGSVYVVQIADAGLLDQAATGLVVRIRPAEAQAECDRHLRLPDGITLHGHSACVTTCSTCAAAAT
jgi:hypothetical protein